MAGRWLRSSVRMAPEDPEVGRAPGREGNGLLERAAGPLPSPMGIAAVSAPQPERGLCRAGSVPGTRQVRLGKPHKRPASRLPPFVTGASRAEPASDMYLPRP